MTFRSLHRMKFTAHFPSTKWLTFVPMLTITFTFHIVDCLMNFFIRSILQEIVVVGYSMLNIQNNNSAKSLWRKSKLNINYLIISWNSLRSGGWRRLADFVLSPNQDDDLYCFFNGVRFFKKIQVWILKSKRIQKQISRFNPRSKI